MSDSRRFLPLFVVEMNFSSSLYEVSKSGGLQFAPMGLGAVVPTFSGAGLATAEAGPSMFYI